MGQFKFKSAGRKYVVHIEDDPILGRSLYFIRLPGGEIAFNLPVALAADPRFHSVLDRALNSRLGVDDLLPRKVLQRRENRRFKRFGRHPA